MILRLTPVSSKTITAPIKDTGIANAEIKAVAEVKQKQVQNNQHKQTANQ